MASRQSPHHKAEYRVIAIVMLCRCPHPGEVSPTTRIGAVTTFDKFL